jgi:hypothetical protein
VLADSTVVAVKGSCDRSLSRVCRPTRSAGHWSFQLSSRQLENRPWRLRLKGFIFMFAPSDLHAFDLSYACLLLQTWSLGCLCIRSNRSCAVCFFCICKVGNSHACLDGVGDHHACIDTVGNNHACIHGMGNNQGLRPRSPSCHLCSPGRSRHWRGLGGSMSGEAALGDARLRGVCFFSPAVVRTPIQASRKYRSVGPGVSGSGHHPNHHPNPHPHP